MFCPKCSAYLSERDLIKTNIKYAPGNVAVEYAAQCPRCSVDMGRVSWGQLTVNPDIKIEPSITEQPAEPQPAPAAPAPNVKRCPHCGKQLPADY